MRSDEMRWWWCESKVLKEFIMLYEYDWWIEPDVTICELMMHLMLSICQSHEFVKSWNLAMMRILLYIYISLMARQAAGQATASYKAFTWMPEWVEAIGLWGRWWAQSKIKMIKTLKVNSLMTIIIIIIIFILFFFFNFS